MNTQDNIDFGMAFNKAVDICIAYKVTGKEDISRETKMLYGLIKSLRQNLVN